MKNCPTCGKILKREIEKVYEIDDTKYFDLLLKCENCGYSKPVTISRKNPVPKARDEVVEMAASLKLRKYLPERKEITVPKVYGKTDFKGESIKKALSPLRHGRKILFYSGAILLGLVVEILGLYLESQLRILQINPLAGFVISLLIFVFAPIIIVGSIVYHATGDRLKSILVGSLAVPLTIILLAKLRLELWVA